MQKGKESLERKLKNNKNNTEGVSHNIEMRFKKSARTKASAMLSGLGSDKEETQEE